MNEIINKFSLEGDKFMSEIHFTYSACGPFTRIRERIKKIEKQEIQYMLIEMH